MNSLNSILIEGNLSEEPEISISPKGTSICTFTVETKRFFDDNEQSKKEISYFNIEVWSTLAENCNKHLEKGRGVRVVGRLKQDRWVDREGRKHARVKIIGEHVEFKPPFKETVVE